MSAATACAIEFPTRGASSRGAVRPDDLLRGIGSTRQYARGETIFSEGDLANLVYKVAGGAIRMCRHRVNGRRQIADFRLPGDYIGISLNPEYGVTAESASDTSVTVYHRSAIDKLCDENRAARRLMVRLLSDQLKSSHDHLVMLGRQTASERMIAFLLMLAERSRASSGATIALPMSRQDIADYLGLTIETVCRVLTALKRKRLIETPNLHEVVLRDLEALTELAEGDE